MEPKLSNFSFHKNEFIGICKHLQAKDQISFLTTNKKIYKRITQVPVDIINPKVTFRHLCNNMDSFQNHQSFFLKSLPSDVVELRCGDPFFPLDIQFAVYAHIFKFSDFKPQKMLINSKIAAKNGEVNQLLKVMNEAKPIMKAFKELELCYSRFEEDLDLICNRLPNLTHYAIQPVVNLSLSDNEIRLRYAQLFQERNIHFVCDMSIFEQSRPIEERRSLAGCYVTSFMNSLFRHVHTSRVFYKNEEKGDVFGFYMNPVE